MLYRWPQGRVIRTIFMVLTVVIAADLAWQGAYGQIEAYFTEADLPIMTLIIGCIYATLALIVLVGGIAMIGFVPKTAQFMIEVENEMAKVTWPNRRDVVRATITITVMTAILAVLIFVVDFINHAWAIEGLLSRGDGA